MRVNRIYIIAILFLAISCQKKKISRNTQIPVRTVQDSINNYIDKSKTDTISIRDRLALLNRAIELADEYKCDTLILKAISYKTKLFSEADQLDSAIIYSKKLLQRSEKIADSLMIGKAYYKLGLYTHKNNISDSAYYYYNLSKNIFIHLQDSVEVGKRLLNMAIIQSDGGDYLNSDVTAIEALDYLKNQKDSNIIGSIQNCLAISAKRRKDYKESLHWYKKAIATTKSEINRLRYSNNIANVYLKQGNYKKAITLYELLIKDSLVLANIETKARVLDNLAYAQWLNTGNESLEDDFYNALKMRIDKNDLHGQIASNSHLSEYFEERNNVKSIRFAERMYEISTEVSSIDDRLEALKKLVKLEKDPDQLKKYSQLYFFLNDSLTYNRENHKNSYARFKYDTEKNRSDNFNLKIKNAENLLKLEKSNKQKTIFLFSGLLFILSAIFAYFLSKAKHKKEKLQQVYVTEKRIAKKVHDEVANDVYHVMIKLQAESNNEADVLDDLENIYEKTRDISKENSAIDLDENFRDSLNDLLLNYNKKDITIVTKGLSKIDWESISDIKKTTTYRVLQELMINMKKHSKASIAVLSFKEVKNKVTIEYKDNGVGCNLKKGAGLQNVENRIQSINGIVTFESQTNKGFNAKIMV